MASTATGSTSGASTAAAATDGGVGVVAREGCDDRDQQHDGTDERTDANETGVDAAPGDEPAPAPVVTVVEFGLDPRIDRRPTCVLGVVGRRTATVAGSSPA